MRRWMSILLVMLLAFTPVASMAESYEIKMAVDVDGEALAPVLTEVLRITAQTAGEDVAQKLTGGMDVAQLAQMTELLMDAVSLTVQVQPDGVRVSCSMQDKEVCSFFLTWNEKGLALCTSLLPDLKLVVPLNEMQEAASQVAAVDWYALGGEAVARVYRWATSLRGDVYVGSFAGDAYEGGVKRVEYHVTDADIADLMESLLLGMESNEALMTLLDQLLGQENVAAILRSFREYNLQVRLDSDYHYAFSMVYDKQNVLVGMSLNVMEAEELIAAVSFGANAAGDAGRVIVSIPLGSGVVYVDGAASLGEKVSFSFSVYQSPELISYQQAAQDSALLVQRQEITFDRTDSENGYMQEIRGVYTGDVNSRVQSLQVVVNEPYSFVETSTMWLGDGDKPVAVTTTTARESDVTNTFDDGLTALDMTQLMQDPSVMEALQNSVDKGIQNLMVLLIQALPPQLMTLMVQGL